MPLNPDAVMEQIKAKVNQRVTDKLEQSYAGFANEMGQLFPNGKVLKTYGMAIGTGRTQKEAYEQAFRPLLLKKIARKVMEEIQEYLDAQS